MRIRQGWLIILCTLLLPFFAHAKREFRDLNAELIHASAAGSPKEITGLIKEGAQPTAKNMVGTPALSLAATRGDDRAVEAIAALLASGASIEVKDEIGRTPLFYAASMGRADNVQFLLERGAQYYHTDNEGNIARTIAHNEGHNAIVTLMDDFVKEQTAQIYKQYEQRDALVKEQVTQANKRIEQAQQKETDVARQSEEVKKEKAQLVREKEAALIEKNTINEAIKEEDKTLSVSEQIDKKIQQNRDLRGLIQDLSLNICTYNYWHFTKLVSMQTELSEEERDAIIAEALDAIDEITKTLKTAYNADDAYIKNIADPSKNYILEQIRPLPSNAHLASEGIGNVADAEKRCKFMAYQWDIEG